ncbi:MAG TPA: EAL domain-containing protein [Acidimicrobiales bacterium]|nr:EAL domain-containing protein [Acidimicrobiales bacterium]
MATGVVGVFVAASLSWTWAVDQRADVADAVQSEARQAAERAARELEGYKSFLRGAVGLLDVVPEASGDSVAGYLEAAAPQLHHPGMHAVAVVRLDADGTPRVTGSVAVPGHGHSHELPAVGEVLPLVSAPSLAGTGAAAVEPDRRRSETHAGQHDLLVSVPHYRPGAPLGTAQARRDALAGWVVGLVHSRLLLDAAAPHDVPVQLALRHRESFDLDQGLVLAGARYREHGAETTPALDPPLATADLAPLHIELRPLPGFADSVDGYLRNGPWLAFAGGGLATALLVLLLCTRGRRAGLPVREVAEAAPVGMFRLDRDFGVRFANERLVALAGTADWLEAIHEDDRARVAADWTACDGAGDYVGELRLQLADGRLRWVRVRAAGVAGGWVGTVEDLTDVVKANARLQQQSFHDPLTGLANRAHLLRHLEALVAAGDRALPVGAVLYLDVDDLKVINDSLGHDRGDELLVEVARRLRQATAGRSSVVARFGGDEFALLWPEAGDDDLAEAAELVRSCFREPFVLDGREMLVSASIGIAVAHGGTRAAEVLQDADAAMYRAKETNRGGQVVFDAVMRAGALERLDLVQSLWRAIDRQEMVLHYQPKVSLVDDSLVGFEALVRWQHPERGLVPPDTFIGLAEETGLIVPLGRWVLEEACRQAAEWAGAGTDERPLSMAVNLSAAQLAVPDLAGDVARILAATGLAASQLCLEITESVLMEDPDAAVTTLHQLKALGVQLAVDDFGTGYSSLGSLRRFPVDQLKIDRTFVRGIGQDPEDETIVRLVLNLASALSLEVVAEGVEHEVHRRRLQEFGCGYGQGFLWGAPVPASAIHLPPGRPQASAQADADV